MFSPKSDLEQLQAVKESWPPQDEAWRAEQLAYHYFFWELLWGPTKNGRSIEGCSFSQRGTHAMLVVRSTFDGLPQVAYTTEKNPTACVRTFCRMYLEGRVQWHKDKFR